jgi:hypothetical protein
MDSSRICLTKVPVFLCHPVYIYSLVMFVVNNMDLIVINFYMYTTVTRNSSNLYFPLSNLTIFWKGPQYFDVKVYNNLPGNIKQLYSNKNQFRIYNFFIYIHFVV